MARHLKKYSFFSLSKVISKQIKKEYNIDCERKYGIPSFTDLAREMENYYSMMDRENLLSLEVEYKIDSSPDSSIQNSLSRATILISMLSVLISCLIVIIQTYFLKLLFTLLIAAFTFLIMVASVIDSINNRRQRNKAKYIFFKLQCVQNCLKDKI